METHLSHNTMGHWSLQLSQNLDLHTGHGYPRRKGIVSTELDWLRYALSKGVAMAKITTCLTL